MAGVASGHEPWILRPDEIRDALAQPKPAWFTELNATNIALIAADLIIQAQDSHWWWLREIQLLLAVGLAFGIYVRLMAVGLLLLCGPAFYLFGGSFLPYAGAVIGCASYLLLQGSGAYAVRWPAMARFRPIQRFFQQQPCSRAQFLMRVFTGFSILYAGVTFKVFQPQLMYQILREYSIPLLSAFPDFFTLLMALVEVSAGLLIIAGVLLRPLSLFFLGVFLFFAAMLPESFMAHSMYYGVMLSFLFNGAGFWRLPKATDKTARVVIIGGGYAAGLAAGYPVPLGCSGIGHRADIATGTRSI